MIDWIDEKKSDNSTKQRQATEAQLPVELLVSALLVGKQITNGPQYISWSAELNRGYMCCDTPECCDYDFDSIEEITEFIDAEDWEVVAH